MKIPNNFKNEISKAFYDKEIDVFTPIEKVDEELSVIVEKGNIKETILCNAHITSKELVLKEYGLSIEASIYFSCSNTLAVENDYIDYNGITYICTAIIKKDTHTNIFAKR